MYPIDIYALQISHIMFLSTIVVGQTVLFLLVRSSKASIRIPVIYMYIGVSIAMGVPPIAGWFIMENPMKIRMI